MLFTITGGLAGLAGSIAASRIGSGNPRIGDGFEFDVIIAIILGGTRLTGGRGTILGTLIGALIVAVIASGLNMLGMLSFWQKVINGANLRDTFVFSKNAIGYALQGQAPVLDDSGKLTIIEYS